MAVEEKFTEEELAQFRSMRFRHVVQVGMAQNGWTVLAVVEEKRREGEVPHGVILASKDFRPAGDLCGYLTANWNGHQSGIMFDSGHYDMTWQAAMEDLADRVGPLP